MNKTLISAAIAAAFAASLSANAQNVSEGEIDQTTGQPSNEQQGGQANVNELKDPASTQAQPGAPTAGTANQNTQTQSGQSTGQSQQGGQSGQSTGQSQQQGGQQSGQATGQSQQPGSQSGQATGQSSDQGSQRQPAEGPAQGQGPQPDHSTTGETTGQGQGVKDTGGEAAAGTHRDQGGDPTRGSGNTTGAAGTEKDKPAQ